ncbi:unnamed protein product [Diabrotica balteata]|uniref:Uncharacterized protein n=1 Tax=Diabrotica balteata TaxID=107213 RepID=A0A9N9SNI4_DIABA|nr:unnamed protein product [Diabrotica balteata]
MKIDNYWLNPRTPTSSRFNSLNEEFNVGNEETQENVKIPKPPPIFIAGVNDTKPLNLLLNSIAKENKTIIVLNDDQVKVQAKTIEIYIIIKALDEKKTEYHTYKKRR